MSNGQNTGIWGILVTGVLALLGTSVGSTLKGYWDIQLEEKEFQSQLIMKALESSEVQERQEFLQFLIDTNLVDDKEIKEGLTKYSSGGEEKATPPQLKTTQGDFQRTDIDLWYCQGSEDTKTAQEQVYTIHNRLRERGFGQVRERIWTLYKEISKQELEDKVTVIVDEHEKIELPLIENALVGFPYQIMNNIGEPTAWRISIIVCPTN